MRPVPLGDSCLLSIEKTLTDEITMSDGSKLFLDSTWNPEQHATVSGTITELPKNHSTNLSIGDTVAFSYTVCSERQFPRGDDAFVEHVDTHPHCKIWMNGKGEKLRMAARPGVISLIWTATHFDRHGRFIPEHGFQGTERQVDGWLHKNFTFGKPENFAYKNLITYNQIEYWKCPLENVFAKKVGDEIISVSDRIICEPIDIDIDKRVAEVNGIKLPDGNVAMRLYDRAVAVSGGEGIGVKKGDIVAFEGKYVEKYDIFGKLYFLIRERRVEGIWEDAA